jgi:vanillate O-demethylase ferredoxin subunit
VQPRLLDVKVTGIRQLTPRVREFLLGSVDGTALPACEPGAHVELHTVSPTSGPLVRHYSLVGGVGTWDDTPDTYRIAVQREDRRRGSAHIHDTFAVGTLVQASVPKNNFPLDRRDRKSLLVAGGIGITPILAMLRSLVRRQREFEIVYAGRSAADMAYRQDVQRLAGERARIHASAEPVDLRALLTAQPEGTTAYLCGPQPMVQAAHDAAGALGWDPRRVRSELFTAGPRGDEVAFDVELRRSGQRVHVGRDTTILDAFTAAGVQPLFDCRRGECGLCATPVIEADGPICHRDNYLSQAERTSQMCICVSRVQGTRLVLDA